MLGVIFNPVQKPLPFSWAIETIYIQHGYWQGCLNLSSYYFYSVCSFHFSIPVFPFLLSFPFLGSLLEAPLAQDGEGAGGVSWLRSQATEMLTSGSPVSPRTLEPFPPWCRTSEAILLSSSDFLTLWASSIWTIGFSSPWQVLLNSVSRKYFYPCLNEFNKHF